MGWQIPSAFGVLAKARAAAGAPGVKEALDEGTAGAESLGHTMTLRKIEEERDSLLARAGS